MVYKDVRKDGTVVLQGRSGYQRPASAPYSGDATPPSPIVGDEWINTANNNERLRWDGTAWVSVRDGNIAEAQGTADQAIQDAVDAFNAATAANNLASEAEQKADEALTTGGQAVEDAADARDAANAAQSSANTALTNAAAASSAASAAQSAANSAQMSANQGISDAEDAFNAANAARTSANNASSAAATADGKAVVAQNAATSAAASAAAADSKAILAQGAATTADGKAVAAQSTANSRETPAGAQAKADLAKAQIDSRGADLVTNGTGSMRNNTNFSAWVGFSDDLPTGAARAFTHAAGVQVAKKLDELIPVNITRRYRLSYSVKQLGTTAGGFRSYLVPHDAFKLDIQPQHYMFEPGTLTTLAVELKDGDTTVTLTDSTNWYGKAGKPAGARSHYRSIIWWDYVDPAGKAWEPETYSRSWSSYDTWADGGITGNVITLKVPYDGPTRPVGTKLSNGSAGQTYMYGDPDYRYPPNTWTNSSGDFEPKIVAPGQVSASNVNGWPVATAYVKVGFLLNYPPGPSNSQHAIANVALSDAAAVQGLTDSWTYTGTTSINGGAIRTDTIEAGQIKADAITAKHTLTGALYQTVATANRGVKITSAGLVAYNGIGTPTTTINATSGAITTTGSVLSGGSVTGSMVQSSPSAARGIKFNDAALIAYNATGTPTFTIDANTGSVSMVGSLNSGSTITGATLTGGTIQTATGSNKVVRMNSSGLIAYDGASSPIFFLDTTTGTATFKGAIQSGSTIGAAAITGATVTGGTIQTATGNNKTIRMNSSGLVGYNATGEPVINYNSADGSLTLKGDITSGSTITGATVTGGLLQTSATGTRGIKINNAGLLAYNAAGVPTLSIDGETGAIAMTGDITSGSTITGTDITGGTIRSHFNVIASGSSYHINMGPTGDIPGGTRAVIDFNKNLTTLGRMYAQSETVGGVTSELVRITAGQGSVFGAKLVLEGQGSKFEVKDEVVAVPFQDRRFGVYSSVGGADRRYVFRAESNGYIFAPELATNTGGTAVMMGVGGQFYKASSASRYKVAVEEIPLSRLDHILDITPKTWQDLGNAERYSAYCAGDDSALDEVDPLRRIPGAIAEDLEATGLTEFVTYSPTGDVEGIMYDRLAVALIPIIKDLRTRIEALEA